MRYRVLALLTAVGVLSSCSDSPAGLGEPEPQPQQLLLNADVEEGSDAPDAWFTNGSLEHEFEWSSQDAGSGSRSLAIRSQSIADGGAYWVQSVEVDEPTGAMFRLTAQVKLNGMVGPGTAIAIRGDDTSLGNGFAEVFATTQQLELLTGTEGWHSVRIGLAAVPPSVDRLTVFLIYLPDSSGEVLFDDMALEVIEGGISSAAEAYLGVVLDIMENNSINRYVIDWADFRERAWSDAAGAEVPADTYPAIRLAIERLGDNHSFLQVRPLAVVDPPPALPTPPAKADPTAALLDSDLGYVEVPAFSGGGSAADELATEYHRLIEGVDTLETCGWVVDLRGNTGGNIWPMIAGVGPIVGEDTLGFSVDPDDVVVVTRSYRGGTSFLNDIPRATATDPYSLVSPYPPVSVLTDSLTASSGEGVAIAFRGRPGARSFGMPTRGLSTANQGFPLSDGAVLFLTVATMADRTGQLYGGKVVPDEIVEGTKTGNPATDLPLQAAIDWLHGQPACMEP